MRGSLAQQTDEESDIQQLEETKTLQCELKDIRAQLEREGYASMAQMRYLFHIRKHVLSK